MLTVWKHSPMLRVLTPFLFGILLEIHVGLDGRLPIFCALLSGILWAYFHFIQRPKFINRYIHGAVLFVFLSSAAVLLTQSFNPLRNPSHLSNLADDSYDSIELILTEAPVPKEKSLKVVTRVLAVWKEGKRAEAEGLLLTYLKKDSLSQILAVDDTILISTKPSPLQELKNPFEFNYKKYLNNHYIYSQVFLSSDKWVLKNKALSYSFSGKFVAIREHMLSVLRSYGVSGQEYAVLSALVLGKTSEIDYHLMLSYASAGAIHILAVSGLHVGLIYTLLAPVMRRIFPKGKYRFVRFIIPVFMLWLYAGVTGFSPSVLRAAWMFTCFIIADTYSKTNNIFNTMSTSAFILLWWNPYIIMEVGFQLSYLAVLGIVTFQRKIAQLIFTRNKILKWLWSLTAVSFAAQLSTFALGLLYFHQFPNWFLVSNLFVIPLATIILYITLAFFAFTWFPPLAVLLVFVSVKLTRVMNNAMLFIDQIPYSITQGISITVFESYMIAGVTLITCYWLLWKKPKALLPAVICAVLLSFTQLNEKLNIIRHNEICVHSISDHSCITYTNGERAAIFYNKDLVGSESKVRFHLKNYWDHLGIKKFDFIPIDSIGEYHRDELNFVYPFIQIADLRIAIVDSLSVKSLGQLHCDFYLFNHESKPLFFADEQLKYLSSSVAILSDDVGSKKKKFLSERLNAALVKDLSEGALVIRGKSVFRFSEFY